MLWAAAYWRDASTRTPVAGDLETPALAYLLTTWGRAGDVGVLAETKDRRALGAAWYRFWTEEQHSYGFVSPTIPELAVAVAAEARGRGVGTALVAELLRVAEESGVSGVSLSVEPENPARRLYDVEPQDLAFLRKMLWAAAYWRDASTRTPVAGTSRRQLSRICSQRGGARVTSACLLRPRTGEPWAQLGIGSGPRNSIPTVSCRPRFQNSPWRWRPRPVDGA